MSPKQPSPPVLAIALGDPGGIGPEIVLKAVAAELALDDTRYLLIGEEALIQSWVTKLGLGISWQTSTGDLHDGRLIVHNPLSEPLPPASSTPGSPEAARAALAWLKEGAQLCIGGQAHALVTAPVNKESIIRSGEHGFVGQTELISDLAGTQRTTMMLLGHDDSERWLRVALATTHVALRNVPRALTQEKIRRAIISAAQACRDLGLTSARVGVCGLNPHAGEGGLIGDEEQIVIKPAVEASRSAGVDVTGPLAADTLFYAALRGDYDAVVAMYHDQGLVPLKMIGFESGVNWTLGLPFIRTSPDHGTAYDIAGKGQANPSSMIAAIDLAKELLNHKTHERSR